MNHVSSLLCLTLTLGWFDFGPDFDSDFDSDSV